MRLFHKLEINTLPEAELTEHPTVAPFLTVRIRRAEAKAELVGLCAGFEGGSWRAEQFARYLLRNLIQFALPIQEWSDINTVTAVEQLSKAARSVYTTNNYHKRGEVGELILFSIMREYYKSIPIVSKFYFKSAANDTVKGFDAVHIVINNDEVELWLGEVKFYSNISAAIRDVLIELFEHIEIDYMREEFMWIERKMGENLPKQDEIRRLLDENTSLDDIFDSIHVPILLTYKSPTICQHNSANEEYISKIQYELNQYFDKFMSKNLPIDILLHLFLVPMEGKAHLLQAFDDRLRALQRL